MGTSDDVIDLKKLSQRELLIGVYNKVESLEKTSFVQTERQNATDIKLAVLTTKMQTWAAVIGFVSGLASSLVVGLVLYVIKN